MQLIDEDYQVPVFHQLFHDGLQTFLKLPAVFSPCDNQRDIERQNLLVEQLRGDLTVDDALRQSFHNGGLPYAGLADEHRIVLRPPAEDLNHAFDFVLSADQRIESVVHGRFGKIPGELDEA